jgi:WD40 repeat protein
MYLGHNWIYPWFASLQRKSGSFDRVWRCSALALLQSYSYRVSAERLVLLLLLCGSFTAIGCNGEDEQLLAKEPHSVILDKDGGGPVFSPDGKSLFFSGPGRTVKNRYGIPKTSGVVKICDLSSRKSRILVEWSKMIGPIALSPDGTLLAGDTNDMAKDSMETTDRIIIIWKAKTGERLAILKSDQLLGLGGAIFSSDGKTLLALASSKALDTRRLLLTLWEIPSGKLRRTIELGKKIIIYGTQVSPDGKTLAISGLARDGEYGKQESILEMPSLLKLLDVVTGKELAEHKGLIGPLYSVAFSPDGKLLATGGNNGKKINEILLWDLVKKERHAVLTGHRGVVHQVAFSHDGKLLASAGGSQRDGEIRLWDVKKLREVVSLKGHTDAVTSISFSPDDSLLASGARDGTIRLWYLRQPAKDKRDR